MDILRIDSEGLRAVETTRRTSGSVAVRQASFDDYNQIAALQTRNGLTSSPYQSWAALWLENPAYHGWKADWPIGWVIQAGAGDLVGFIGNIPIAYQFRRRQLRVATPACWVVDVAYRSYSILLLDRVARQRGIDLVIGTTVGPTSECGFKALKFSKVPAGIWNESAFWITNYRGFSQSILRWKSIPFAATLSYPVSAALFSRDTVKRASRQLDSSIAEVETCSAFDIRFDEFWYTLIHENPDVLLAVRTRETLEWHFRDSMRDSTWIVTASKGPVLTAYAIFQRQDNPESGLKRVRLIDFEALKGSEQMLLSFLNWMLRKCRTEEIHVLEILGCWLARPNLPQVLAPYYHRLGCWTYYYTTKNTELSETLKRPRFWAPSSFDGDASLGQGIVIKPTSRGSSHV